MDIRFDGKTAIVTGGARGIGFSVAAELASSGASVAVLDLNDDGARDAANRIRDAGGRADGYGIDVTDLEAVTAAMRAAADATGGIDVVVNCAGRGGSQQFLQGDPAVWRELIDVNLLSAVNVCYAALPYLVERGGGRVVNIASDAARVGSGGESVYSAAKGGVVSFTKSLAREMARHQITVNCVAPGPTDTQMLWDSGAAAAGIVEKLIKTTPLRRIGRPEDIAAGVLFLASDRACHITGQVLSISGGLTMV